MYYFFYIYIWQKSNDYLTEYFNKFLTVMIQKLQWSGLI